MSLKSATARRRRSLFGVSLGLVLTCPGLVSEQGKKELLGKGLYLLAGTPTHYGNEKFPVSLYSVNEKKKLKPVREIVHQADGLYSVHAMGDVIFVAHPHITPTTVSIIHTNDPSQIDDVVFNPNALIPIENRETLAEPTPSSIDELFPLATGGPSPRKETLVAVSKTPTEAAPRLKTNVWSEYGAMRLDGSPGGPFWDAARFGRIVDANVLMSVFGRDITVETTPPSPLLARINQQAIVGLIAVSKEYSVLAPSFQAQTPSTQKPASSQELLVHERLNGRWKTIQVEGTSSRPRLFGSWLATIVGMQNPDGKINPGRESERNQATDTLPDVRQMYATFTENYKIWLPGLLTLQNLADGRKIRIETGQEDSEILRVEGDIVLYRINDAIYQARIVGNQLRDSTLIVKDEDVPEIHWVFWGPAQ